MTLTTAQEMMNLYESDGVALPTPKYEQGDDELGINPCYWMMWQGCPLGCVTKLASTGKKRWFASNKNGQCDHFATQRQALDFIIPGWSTFKETK